MSTFEDPNSRWISVIGRGMMKPLVFLVSEPIVQVFALYMAVLYGVLYLSLTCEHIVHFDCNPDTKILKAFVIVLTKQYGETTGIAGIHYLAIALGSTGNYPPDFGSELILPPMQLGDNWELGHSIRFTIS